MRLPTTERDCGQRGTQDRLTRYELARVAARRGDRAEALDRLQRAVEAGFAEPRMILGDPDVASLDGERFESLVAKVTANAARLRPESDPSKR